MKYAEITLVRWNNFILMWNFILMSHFSEIKIQGSEKELNSSKLLVGLDSRETCVKKRNWIAFSQL